MSDESQAIRVGELLKEAGLISYEDLHEAEQVSRRLQQPFGRTLMMSGCVSQAMLQAALEAQEFIQQGLINNEIACQGLQLAKSAKLGFKEALERLDVVPKL